MAGGGPRVAVSTASFHARARGSVPGLGGLKETKMFLPHPRVKLSVVGSPLAQFSLYVHKGGLKPDSVHLILYNVAERIPITQSFCRQNIYGILIHIAEEKRPLDKKQ